MLDHACQVGRHPLIERGDDLYETPACAVEALLKVEQLPRRIWEPAAGHGAIVRVLRAAGHQVLASDLNDYREPTHFSHRDFLLEPLPEGVECILTNPPYKLAQEFVEHALELCPHVVMLLRLAFLESQRRAHLLDRGRLARIHLFSRRLPMMHRAGWKGRKASSAIPFAWFVFRRNHSGPTTIDRIRWE